MKKTNYKFQKGSVFSYVLLAIFLILIGILIYLLTLSSKDTKPEKVIHGVETVVQTTPKKELHSTGVFSDKLENPVSSEKYETDKFGEGITEKLVFEQDINNDGIPDKISRTKHENGTAHFYYDYKIELNKNGNYVDITPDGFRTEEGADCSLQKLQFRFQPDFRVIKISRPWEESWNTPTMAVKTVYALQNWELKPINTESMKVICDVSELF